MDDSREERLAKNEALFRTLNEKFLEIATRHGGDEYPCEFVCECSTRGCLEPITLTLPEYERVRGDGTHFLLVPGHEDIEIEQVIAAYEKYVVVEKHGPAGLVADAVKPRTGVRVRLARGTSTGSLRVRPRFCLSEPLELERQRFPETAGLWPIVAAQGEEPVTGWSR